MQEPREIVQMDDFACFFLFEMKQLPRLTYTKFLSVLKRAVVAGGAFHPHFFSTDNKKPRDGKSRGFIFMLRRYAIMAENTAIIAYRGTWGKLFHDDISKPIK